MIEYCRKHGRSDREHKQFILQTFSSRTLRYMNESRDNARGREPVLVDTQPKKESRKGTQEGLSTGHWYQETCSIMSSSSINNVLYQVFENKNRGIPLATVEERTSARTWLLTTAGWVEKRKKACRQQEEGPKFLTGMDPSPNFIFSTESVYQNKAYVIVRLVLIHITTMCPSPMRLARAF